MIKLIRKEFKLEERTVEYLLDTTKENALNFKDDEVITSYIAKSEKNDLDDSILNQFLTGEKKLIDYKIEENIHDVEIEQELIREINVHSRKISNLMKKLNTIRSCN